jgi:hypothetical protein
MTKKYCWYKSNNLPNIVKKLNAKVPWNGWGEQALMKNALENNKFLYMYSKIAYKINDLQKLINEFKKIGLRFVASYSEEFNEDENTMKDISSSLLVADDSVLEITNAGTYVVFEASSFNKELINVLKASISKYTSGYIKQRCAYVITNNPMEGPSLTSVGRADLPLERDNYERSVISDYDHIVSQLNCKEPFGRLTILNGPPGTGKTYLVRGILNEVKNANVVLVPPNLIPDLAGPQMIRVLSELRPYSPDGSATEIEPTILIIEDADQCLVERGSVNAAHISGLLNFGDGILGSLLDVRIIATTNADKLQIDKALLRPGRLCRLTNVGSVSEVRAKSIYKRLTNKQIKTFGKSMVSLAEIYAKISDKPIEDIVEVLN